MKYSFLILFAFALSFTAAVRAQNFYSSPYSVYGVGLLNERTATLNRTMGGTGIALQDEFNINPVNPASYGAIISPISHVFEVGFYLESNRYATRSLNQSKTSGGLSNLNYWFKFKPWWASAFGVSPFSSVSYNITTQKQLGSGTEGEYSYEGSGNITRLYWGHSITPVKNLSLGVNFTYLFGSIHKTESISSPSIPSALTLDNKIFTNKLTLDYGVQYRIPLKKKALVIGAVYDNGTVLKGNSDVNFYDENSDTLNTYSKDDIRYTLPRSGGLGLSLQSPRTILAADVKFKQWSKARFSDQELRFNDTWTTSIGFAYLGNPKGERLIDLVSLKTGFYMQNYYLTVKNTTLPSWGLSAGLSIPVFDGKSSVNLTYAYDKLGALENNMVLQHSQKIMIDVVIRDLWGIKRKFD